MFKVNDVRNNISETYSGNWTGNFLVTYLDLWEYLYFA